MRGEESPLEGACIPVRITPAYAGRSRHGPRERVTAEDHPRLCGEKANYNISKQADYGSPPPMRGEVWMDCQRLSSLRITPAYAGRRRLLLGFGIAKTDHPRLCGEKLAAETKNSLPKGSPPPMRGEVTAASSARCWKRITPAYAGRSGAGITMQAQSQDHPRLCGEK